MARYDILSAAPVKKIIADHRQYPAHADELQALLQQYQSTADSALPFSGGIIGYWGYDLSRPQLKPPHPPCQQDPLPACSLGVYDWALIIDHQQQRAQLVSELHYPQTQALLQQLSIQLAQATPPDSTQNTFQLHSEIAFNFDADSYRQAFQRIQDYLFAGDCYQVNLAQRFHAQASGDAFHAYTALRKLSPAPYAAFLDYPHGQILSASPERFLYTDQQQISSKPIKGTRPRGATAQQDQQYISELQQHPKDRAENLMIVDLLRNDLNKNCLPGSVKVPSLFAVESYSNVHHLVSTITGQLKPQVSLLNLLRDCFPGGSITGAPKLRAMQIIDELEPHTRGVYCGSIGYIGFDGRMDTSIVIRTLVYSNHQVRGWVGGGIVADSVMANEYQETFDKASAMLALLQQFNRK